MPSDEMVRAMIVAHFMAMWDAGRQRAELQAQRVIEAQGHEYRAFKAAAEAAIRVGL